GIDICNADAFSDFIGLRLAVDSNTAVPRPLGAMEVAVHAARVADRIGDVAVASFELLHTDDVRVLFNKPFEEAFLHGRADSVQIERDDAHDCRQDGSSVPAGVYRVRCPARRAEIWRVQDQGRTNVALLL